MVDQQRDVLRMFAQRRDAHDDHSDAVVKVFAEIALPDLLAQVLVRGGDDAYVDLDVLVAAYAADPVFLKRPQHLGLRRQRHVADLVHEQRAAVGLFELAPSLLDGRGEGAAFVAEEFAFDQFRGDRRAVDLDERSRGAVAFGVQPAGDKLFAGAVFARDQHARFARRDLVDQQADMFDLGRGADDMLRLRIVPAAGAACRGRRGGGHGGRVVDRAVDGLQQAVHVDGFGQIVLGAVAYGLHGRVD